MPRQGGHMQVALVSKRCCKLVARGLSMARTLVGRTWARREGGEVYRTNTGELEKRFEWDHALQASNRVVDAARSHNHNEPIVAVTDNICNRFAVGCHQRLRFFGQRDLSTQPYSNPDPQSQPPPNQDSQQHPQNPRSTVARPHPHSDLRTSRPARNLHSYM
jgi:hypothetical protein